MFRALNRASHALPSYIAGLQLLRRGAATRRLFGSVAAKVKEFGEDEADKITVSIFEEEYDYEVYESFHKEMFPASIERVIGDLGFEQPTSIQSHCIPIAMDKKDLIGVAKTGSGKTLAFMLPALNRILEARVQAQLDGQKINNRGRPMALVLAPTRELANQIAEATIPFSSKSNLRVVTLYGGVKPGSQISSLERGVDVIVATPGRLIDLADQGYIDFSKLEYLVLDEADRMLDMGFIPQIENILESIPPKRQNLLLSATWPKEIQALSRKVCSAAAVHIQVGTEGLTVNKKIEQQVLVMVNYDKWDRLLQMLESQPAGPDYKILIFAGTKRGCDHLEEDLSSHGYKASAIHGDKSQNIRDRIISNFKTGRLNILIATDVASRGLDISSVRKVINYDFPQTIEDYVHRIGRTGRAGQTGESVTFFTSQDAFAKKDLINLLKKSGKEVPEQLYALEGRGDRKQGQRNRQRGNRAFGGRRGGYNDGFEQRRGGFGRRQGGHRNGGQQRRRYDNFDENDYSYRSMNNNYSRGDF